MHGFTQNTQITQNPPFLIRIQRMFFPTFFYCVMSVRADMLAIISGAEVLPTLREAANQKTLDLKRRGLVFREQIKSSDIESKGDGCCCVCLIKTTSLI